MTDTPVTRRVVVLGATAAMAGLILPAPARAVVPAIDTATSVQPDDDLLVLVRELRRLRRHIGVLERRMHERETMVVALCVERGIPMLLPNGMQSPGAEALRVETGHVAAWTAWSTTIDVAERLANRIGRIPARSLLGLSAKHDALCRSLYHDRPDGFEARRLTAFGRELRAFARE